MTSHRLCKPVRGARDAGPVQALRKKRGDISRFPNLSAEAAYAPTMQYRTHQGLSLYGLLLRDPATRSYTVGRKTPKKGIA